MGGKPTRAGMHIHLRLAVIMIGLLLAACAAPMQQVEVRDQNPRDHVLRAQRLFSEGNYEGSLRESQQVLTLSPDTPPADEALFLIALVYVNPKNPKKDSSLAMASFTKLITKYPVSAYLDQAKTWVAMLREYNKLQRSCADTIKENERLRRTNVETIKENERLKRAQTETTRENAKLRHIIEESSKIDIEIEEKKRESTR